MADPEWILLEAVREYPYHTPAFYAEMCRFNLPWTRAALFKMAQQRDLLMYINFHSGSDATYRVRE